MRAKERRERLVNLSDTIRRCLANLDEYAKRKATGDEMEQLRQTDAYKVGAMEYLLEETLRILDAVTHDR